MDAPADGRSPNVFDILRARVRAASDGQLVIAVSLGLLGLVILVILRRWPWPAIASCGLLLGAGVWGILDRSKSAPPSFRSRELPAPLVAFTRNVAGFVGLLSLLVLLLGAFGLCLGPWIS
jgi:hypothetical protein